MRISASIRRLGERVWWLAGLATRRPPRKRWVDVDQDAAASEVA